MKGTKTLLSYLLFIIGLQWKTVYALPGGCEEGEFLCANKNCIVGSWRCDGEDDCGDNSDELECKTKTIRQCDESNNFRCKNGKCVPKSWTCDTVDDCRDGSDESSLDGPLCLKTDRCARDDFKCKTSGACILKPFVCDGYANCLDGSDEKDCASRTCTEDEFKCTNGRCISSKWKCDRSDDCGDASDENNCQVESCSSTQFQCVRSKHCIRSDYRCDNSPDCLDGSDEKGCNTTVTPTQRFLPPFANTTKSASKIISTKQSTKSQASSTTTTAPCRSYEFTCQSDKKCVHNSWLCDGEWDCEDGHDESQEVCRKNTCNDDEFRCGNGKCIESLNKCDSIDDCGDGSDEKDCPEVKVGCTKETHQCKGSNKCIDHTQVCNGNKDCPEGDDESDLCGVNECLANNGGCEHNCSDLPLGYRCSCKYGYELAQDNETCVDIDECKKPGTCTQACKNYKGGYACECNQGYRLDPVNKKTCRAEAPVPFLVFSNRYDIREVSTSDHVYNKLISDTRGAVAISLDIGGNMIYWADNVNKTINRAPRNGQVNSLPEIVISTGIQKPEGLAVDWVGKKLYWTDSLYNHIAVSDLDGKNRKVFLNGTSVQEFRGITVDPEKGFVYWTDWGKEPKIERAHLDGKNRATVVDMKHVTWPASVTIDKTLQRLFWSDLSRRQICSSNLDGSDIRKIVIDLSSPYGLTVFEEFVYWTDYTEQKIYKANKFNGLRQQQFEQSFFAPMDINVFHPLAQKKAAHPCQENQGGCSHLCFISPSSADNFVCACPDFLALSTDGKTCVKSLNPPTVTPSTQPAVCPEFTCQQTRQCLTLEKVCDGKPDCPLHDDERSCTTKKPTSVTTKKPSGSSSMLFVYVGIGAGLILVIIIVIVVIYRRKRSKFGLQMIYETDTEMLHSKEGKDSNDVEVKYVTNKRHHSLSKKHSKNNFDNINFRPMDEAKLPLQMNEMEHDLMIDDSDNSSGDLDFDDMQPIIPLV